MAGEKGEQIGYNSSEIVYESDDPKFFNRLNKQDTFIQHHKTVKKSLIMKMLKQIDNNTNDFMMLKMHMYVDICLDLILVL